MYTKREIEAIKIVMNLNRREMSFIDHFYCGDKDTYAEAFDTVMENHDIKFSFWDYPREDFEKYQEMYRDEITEEYSKLVDWGKSQMEFLKGVEKHLEGMIENVEANMNWNYFDFPDGEIEIDSSDFDPNNN